MTKILLLRALDLLGSYVNLVANCRCTDKIKRAELYSKVSNLLDDVEAHQKDGE
jgi:hypothetical protein